jgi:hypothetical protein
MFSLSCHQINKHFSAFALKSLVIVLSLSLALSPAVTYGQQAAVLGLPRPGAMVELSPAYVPVLLKGLRIHEDNPLSMDFILDTGDSGLRSSQDLDKRILSKESQRLIKYFLAALTLPEKDVWVNLSPYEKDRIIPAGLGQTEMGRDMLAQDYILKQITASLIYPERGLGKDFWDRIYREAYQKFGTTQIPVNTFNKVWIVADKADVYENKDTAFVIDSHLKVMLEQDYLSLQKHSASGATLPAQSQGVNSLGSQIVREIIIPALEKEVNQGRNFANLRQIFNSLILAKWYKQTLKQALINQVYSNKSKVAGVEVSDKTVTRRIYAQYLAAYKKGVFNFIKEDLDQATQQPLPRKYFSGGVVGDFAMTVTHDLPRGSRALQPGGEFLLVQQSEVSVNGGLKDGSRDSAMLTFNERKLLFSSRAASNTPNVLEGVNFDNLDEGSREDLLGKALPLLNLTDKNPLAAGLDITLLQHQMEKQRADLYDSVREGKLGNLEINPNVEFKVVSDKVALPFGYVCDFTSHVVYVQPSFLKKFNQTNGYLFQFFARKILSMSAKSIILPAPVFFDEDSDAIKQEKIDLHDGQQKLLTEAARRDLEEKYIEDVVLPLNTALTENYDRLFKKGSRPSQIRKALNDSVAYMLEPAAAAIDELKSKYTTASPGSVEYVSPSAETIAMNREIYRLGVAAANIMAVNAMDGISEYTSRWVEKKKEDIGDGVMGDVLKMFSTSANERKTKLHVTISKFNPPTWAHTIVTVLLPFALSGADVLIVSPSEFSNVKREINKTFPERKALLEAEMKGLLGDLPFILTGDVYLSKDKELNLPFRQINNMKYWNGEEILYMLCQQFNEDLQSVSYAAGGDYNYLAQPDGNVSTFDPTGHISTNPNNTSPDMIDYYLFWYLSDPQLYKEFLKLQNNGIDGSKYNRPFNIRGPENTVRKKIFDTLLQEPVDQDWYTDLGVLHKFFNSHDFPMMPRFLVPAKLLMIQNKFPHIKIIFALTMRQGEHKGDDVIPYLVSRGLPRPGKRARLKLFRMDIPGFLSAVSGTAIRTQGLTGLIQKKVNPNGLGAMSDNI